MADTLEKLILMAKGYQVSQILYVVTENRIPDLLKEGPKSGEELAKLTKTNPERLTRLLRAASAFGILFRDPATLSFSLTDVSTLLLDHPASMRWNVLHLCEPVMFNSWSLLDKTVEAESNVFKDQVGVDAFQYYAQSPVSGERFNKAMTAIDAAYPLGTALRQNFNFKNVNHVVDVGGGKGSLMVDMLRSEPHLKGTVFDLPEVIKQAKSNKVRSFDDVESRVTLVGGSFFDTVPSNGDVYLLKFILHDWDDAHAIDILKAVARELKRDKKLLVIELLVDDITGQHTALVDLLMMVINNAKERSVNQFHHLMGQAGLKITRFIPLPPSLYTAIECELC